MNELSTKNALQNGVSQKISYFFYAMFALLRISDADPSSKKAVASFPNVIFQARHEQRKRRDGFNTWEVEIALSTLFKAEKIEANARRMEAVRKLAQERMVARRRGRQQSRQGLIQAPATPR